MILQRDFEPFNNRHMKFDTICLHGGQQADPTTTARAVPIYRTAAFQFPSTERAANLFALKELGNVYTRLMNPTTDVLEKRVAMLEGAHEMAGLGLASGTSAVFYSIINLAQAGDNIVSARNLYGGSYTQFNDILPKLGITVKLVDSNDPQNFASAIDEKTRAVFCESVSNPALEIVDLEAVAKVAHDAGIPLIVDSTFSTPYLTQPIAHGADIVVHSLTKWFGGHGTGLGGIVVDSGRFKWNTGKHPLFDEPDTSYHGLRWGHDLPAELAPLAFILRMRTVPLRNLGACIAPDNSWMFLQGIETLPLRMEKHCQNANAVARYLKAHSDVEWVRFPGLEDDPMFALNQKYLRGKGGAMVIFGIKGGKVAGSRFIEGLKLFSHLANVGDAKSLAIHPATTTHSQLNETQQRDAGITPEMVRLSVGIEDPQDIIADLEQALRAAQA
jgi:O-acetylhomoserine (thiol)-lyase